MANYNNYLDIYNENKKKNKVYDDFLKHIKKIIDENTTGNYANYTCEYYIATTFGINLALLENIFYMFPKLRSNFDIYYDKNHGTNHFHSKAIGLFADRLHAVDHERNYFHPKVQIFKFADEDKYHYIVTVSSMNLTGSDNMEAYVILKGEKSANQGEANQQSATPNGNKFSEYLLTVLNLEEKNEKSNEKSDENKNIEAVKIIKDIGTCVFTLYPEQNKTIKKVEFLDPGDVKETVKNMTDVTVVSPFVSAKLVEELYTNQQPCPIKRLVISCQEKDDNDTYSNKDDNNTYSNIEGFDKFKLDYYAINNLHGKIYCGLVAENKSKEKDSVLIIGSSNFTSAGFGQNAEMNVKITFKDSFFNNSFMAEYFKSSSKLKYTDIISQEKADSDEESFDKRSVIFDINDVTYNNNLYKFNVKTKLKINTDKNGNIFLSKGTTADNTADNTTEFSTKHDTLRIYFKNDAEDIYLTSYLLPNLVVKANDDTFRVHLNKLKEEGNKQFMDNHIMQLLNGESVVKPVRNPEQTTNNKDDNIRESHGTINKTYWHELLLMKSRKCSDGNGFKEWLKGIRTELEKAYNEESASADSKTSITDFIDYVKAVEAIENDKKDENDMKASE